MATSCLPSLLAIAKIKTPTQSAQNRFFDIFPPLVAHSRHNEPDTLSYYFFTSTNKADTSVYGFEAYPNEPALLDVHAKSEAHERQSATIEKENLCTVDVHQFNPIGGFILRDGQVEKPSALVIINEYNASAETILQDFASWVDRNEEEDTATFVVMKHKKTGNIWTFERYSTSEYYEAGHCGSKKFNEISGLTLVHDEFVEAGVGFLWK